jgi:hypothetical protein
VACVARRTPLRLRAKSRASTQEFRGVCLIPRGAVTIFGKAASKFYRLAEREEFEPTGACGFRSRGNDRQGRRLGGPKVERGHRVVSKAAPGPMRAERDACGYRELRNVIRTDIFRGAGSAGSDFADFVITVIFAVQFAIAINITFTDGALRADCGA